MKSRYPASPLTLTAALLISLASIAWLCFKETPQGEHHRLTPVLKANELYPPALTTPGVNPSGRLLVGASQTSGRTNFNSAS